MKTSKTIVVLIDFAALSRKREPHHWPMSPAKVIDFEPHRMVAEVLRECLKMVRAS